MHGMPGGRREDQPSLCQKQFAVPSVAGPFGQWCITVVVASTALLLRPVIEGCRDLFLSAFHRCCPKDTEGLIPGSYRPSSQGLLDSLIVDPIGP